MVDPGVLGLLVYLFEIGGPNQNNEGMAKRRDFCILLSFYLFVDVHSCHVRFAVTLDHAQEFPAVSFVESGVISNQIGGGDALCFQIFHSHVQQLACNALLTVGFLGVNGADIGGQILPVVEIIFDDTQTADDLLTVQA